jgi:MFS family permease
MMQTVVGILALFLSLALLVVGNGMLSTLLALRLELEEYRAAVAGLVLAMYSVGFVLGSLYGIRVIRRVGHIRSFTTFGAIATGAILIHPLHISVPGWMALRLVVGFCVAGLMLVTESWVNARATSETRGQLLAFYMILFYLATAGGQFLISTGDPKLHHLFSLAAILVAFSLVPLSLTRSPVPELHESERLGISALMRISPVGVPAAFLSGVVLSAFTNIGPIYAVRVGLEITQVSVFMGVCTLAAILFQWPVAVVSNHLPRDVVILGVTVIGIVASLLTAGYGGRSTTMLFLAAPLFFGVTASLYALSLALTHDLLDHTQIVPASATLLLSFGLGTVVGPASGAATITWIGPAGLFLFIAASLAVLPAMAVHSVFRQVTPTVEEQTDFVTIAPVTTPTILEIDPRNEEFEPLVEEPTETEDTELVSSDQEQT